MSRNLLIILDYAHGVDVPGKRSPDGRHLEYKWSRLVGSKLKLRLESLGFKVELTNAGEKEIGLSRRKSIANAITYPRSGCKFLVSLHNNAAGSGLDWKNARGFEIFTTKGQTRSDLFAQIIFEQLQRDFPTTEGYKHRTDLSDGDADKEENFTVLTGNTYWGVLVEWLFQDNKEDVDLLQDETVNDRFIESLVKSIAYIDENLEKIKL